MSKDETIDMLFDTMFGTASIREIVERAYDLGATAAKQVPETNHGILTAARVAEQREVFLKENLALQKEGFKRFEVTPWNIAVSVEILAKALREQPDYRESWIDNISVCFQDEYLNKVSRLRRRNRLFIKTLSDDAARNFINIFASEREKLSNK